MQSSMPEEENKERSARARGLLEGDRPEVVVLPGDFASQRQLWGTLWARRGYIVRFAALCTVVFFAFTLGGGIRFQSQGQLYLGEITTTPPAANTPSGDFGLNEAVQGLVASEVEILQSVNIVRRAVLEAGVNVTISEVDAWYLPYWKWLVLRNADKVDAVMNVVRPTNTELAHSARSPQTFTVAFSSPTEYDVLDKELGSSLGHATLGKPFLSPRLTMTLEAGPWGPPRAGARYDVAVAPLDRVIAATQKKLKITVPKQTTTTADINVLTLEYSNPSPKLSASFLEKLMDAYLETRQSWKTEDASAAETFVASQIGRIRDSLSQVESKLAEYRRGNPSVVLGDESKAMVEEIGRYEELRAKTQLEAAALEQIERAAQAKDPPIGAFLVGETQDPVLENMAEKLVEARRELADFKVRYNEAAPEVRQQEGRVADQLESIRAYVVSRSRRAQQTLVSLKSIVDGFDSRLKKVPAAELGLAQLRRESEVYSKTYSYLLERQQDAAIFKASTLSKNHILYAPEVPIRVDSPNVFMRALSLLVGLVLGAGVVLGRALFGKCFHGVSDVKKSIVGVPVIGVITPTEARPGPLEPNGAVPAILDLAALPLTSRFAESFRTLRATLLAWESSAEEGIVSLVTSPQAGDGKTMFTLALAAALCATGKQVLVVDADLRRNPPASPGNQTETGLSTVLRGDSGWRGCLTHVALAHCSFQFLPAGGPDWPELLTTSATADLIAQLRKSFDFVLIDSPSFPAASDALVLAQYADVTFSLVRVQKTPRALTAEHLNGLCAHTKDLGVIVNDAPVAWQEPRSQKRQQKGKKETVRGAANVWSRGAAVSLVLREADPTAPGSKRS
jgi:tyrosine-protein kinase Etk/Wzc